MKTKSIPLLSLFAILVFSACSSNGTNRQVAFSRWDFLPGTKYECELQDLYSSPQKFQAIASGTSVGEPYFNLDDLGELFNSKSLDGHYAGSQYKNYYLTIFSEQNDFIYYGKIKEWTGPDSGEYRFKLQGNMHQKGNEKRRSRTVRCIRVEF